MKEEFLRGLWVVAYREWMRLLHDRPRMISSLAVPLFFFGIIGAGFSRSIGGLAPGVDFVQYLFPGIVAQTVFMTSVFSGLSVVWDREFGFLKEVLVAPIPRTAIALGKTAGAATIASVQALILLALAPVIGVALHPARIPLLVLDSVAEGGPTTGLEDPQCILGMEGRADADDPCPSREPSQNRGIEAGDEVLSLLLGPTVLEIEDVIDEQ